MKPFILSILVLFVLSCDKKETAQPDYTQSLLGDYFMTEMDWGGSSVKLPQNGMTGKITIEKIDLTHIMLTIILTTLGTTQKSTPKKLELKPDQGNVFLLNDGNSTLGAISPTVVDLQATYSQGGTVEFKASR